ncbi:MAG: N-acetylmuramoyl-L-alanine amidase [Cyanobacteria bacterium P01_H01_bin.26]
MGNRRWLSIGTYIGVFCLAMTVTVILVTTYKAWVNPHQAVAVPAPEQVQPTSQSASEPVGLTYAANLDGPGYTPPERIELADPSNYGERYTVDAYGQPLNHDYLAVLHETVWTASSAINFFQTYHPRDKDQASYHAIVDRDGTVIYIVPPDKRAYGAGNSVFEGINGAETATTNPEFSSSVNNFAYHVSLVTPSDGQDNAPTHSGYTDAQYQSLAWLLARTTIPEERITTHAIVDRSGTRQDPRSFNWPHFLEYLHQYPSRHA